MPACLSMSRNTSSKPRAFNQAMMRAALSSSRLEWEMKMRATNIRSLTVSPVGLYPLAAPLGHRPRYHGTEVAAGVIRLIDRHSVRSVSRSMPTDMKRRELLSLVCGLALVRSFSARAQARTLPIVGYLSPGAGPDEQEQPPLIAA